MSNPASRRPSLGMWRATSLVTGNIVGAGLFMLPASLGVYGSLGLLGWILTSLGSICLALVFASLSRRYPKIGGPYAYSRETFGDFIGFQMAWSYWVGTWASNAAIAITLVSYLTIFWPELGTNMTLSFFVSIAAVWFFTFVNVYGVKEAGTIQLISTILKIIPLAAIGLFGMFYVNIDHFTPLNPSDVPVWQALSSAAALTLFSFLGLESATIPAEDVENPETTIPRATVLGTVLAAVIYIGTMVVILGIIAPQDLAVSNAPFADAAGVIFGDWASGLIAVLAVLATLGTLNGWILVQGQMPVAAARDGLFPAFFGKMSKNGTPYLALIVSSVLMTGMLAMNYQSTLTEQFTIIVIFTTFAVLLPYLYSTVAQLYLLLTEPNQVWSGQVIKQSLIAFLGFLYTLVVMTGAGEQAVYLGMIFVFSGFPFYVLMKRHSLKKDAKISS